MSQRTNTCLQRNEREHGLAHGDGPSPSFGGPTPWTAVRSSFQRRGTLKPEVEARSAPRSLRPMT